MAKRVQAHVNPEMLTWAREDQGYSLEEAALALRVEVEKLAAWESGDAPLYMGKLDDIAAKYRRPTAIFFMATPPTGFQPLPDFRRAPDETDERWSPALRTLVRRVKQQQREYLALRHELEEPLTPLPVATKPDDAEAVAADVRRALGVTIEMQRAWKTASDSLREWMHLAEELDVLVVHTSAVKGYTVSDDEMLGFSMIDPVPVIVLNGADSSARRRTFTLVHELAHLFLRATGICDLHDSSDHRPHGHDPTEVFCNAVAAATLMPKDAFLSDPDVASGSEDGHWSDETLGAVGRRFNASREAVLRRLLTFNLTTQGYYQRWRQENQRRHAESAESTDRPPGRPDFHMLRVRELGLSYVATVLEAYRSDAISVGDVSHYLDIKLEKLGRVEEIVQRRQSRWVS